MHHPLKKCYQTNWGGFGSFCFSSLRHGVMHNCITSQMVLMHAEPSHQVSIGCISSVQWFQRRSDLHQCKSEPGLDKPEWETKVLLACLWVVLTYIFNWWCTSQGTLLCFVYITGSCKYVFLHFILWSFCKGSLDHRVEKMWPSLIQCITIESFLMFAGWFLT